MEINPLLQDMLDSNTLSCVDCGTQRTRMTFDQLPPEQQGPFSKLEDIGMEIDYYLNCPNCQEYSIIYKSEGF